MTAIDEEDGKTYSLLNSLIVRGVWLYQPYVLCDMYGALALTFRRLPIGGLLMHSDGAFGSLLANSNVA